MPGGGGGSTTVQLPGNVQNLADQNIADVERITERPYQGYTGPRIAGFSPDTNAGQQVMRNSVGSSAVDVNRARGALDSVINFNPSQVASRDVGFSGTPFRTMQGPGDVSATTLPGMDIGEYLNPYLGAVADPVLREISKKAQADRSTMNAGLGLGGAFGSDQGAIMNAESVANENELRQDALARLYAGGYDTATGLASQDAGRLLDAAIQNQGMGFNVGATNLESLLGTDRTNAQGTFAADTSNQAAALQSALANQQAEIAANNARLQAAGLSGSLGGIDQALQQRDAAGLMGIGDQQRQMGQQSLDLAYGDFLRQQNYPIDMVNLRTAVMTGQPYATTVDTPGGGKGGTMGGLGGLLSGAAALAA